MDVEWVKCVKITWKVVTLRCLCPPLTLWRSWNATRDMVGNVGMGPSGMGIINEYDSDSMDLRDVLKDVEVFVLVFFK